MKRKAVEDEMEEVPILKKCKTTTWQRHLQKFATTKGLIIVSISFIQTSFLFCSTAGM